MGEAVAEALVVLCLPEHYWAAWAVAVAVVGASEAAEAALVAVALRAAGELNYGQAMTLLTQSEQQQVAEAIDRIELDTDAEVVTVLAAQADDYHYIPLLWAGVAALIFPGLVSLLTSWLGAGELLLAQWITFIVLALVFRLPQVTTRLIPQSVRHWRASNLARRQFIELNLHHTDGGTGMLIFVSEAERYVEILVDRGISSRIDNAAWESIVETFSHKVRKGEVLQGFLGCIESCGMHLKQHVPGTHDRNELSNRLVVLP
ncbi:MAG: putative membrane protein [Halopseudomonas sp.]